MEKSIFLWYSAKENVTFAQCDKTLLSIKDTEESLWVWKILAQIEGTGKISENKHEIPFTVKHWLAFCSVGDVVFTKKETQMEIQMETLKKYAKNKCLQLILVLVLMALVGGGVYSDKVAQAILVILGQG